MHQGELLHRVVGAITDEDGPGIRRGQPVHEVGAQLGLTVEGPPIALVEQLDQAEDGGVALAAAVVVDDLGVPLTVVVLAGDHPGPVLEELGIGQAAVVVEVSPVGETELVAVVDVVETLPIQVSDDPLLIVTTGLKPCHLEAGLVIRAWSSPACW